MRIHLPLVVVLLVTPATAQVLSRPTDPPLVTAASESWYALREPIAIAGDLYYPAGAVVFFNGNTMVRSGHYNGVPLYSDTTIEPFSVFYVPVTRGLMQPYERVRGGLLAGTSGSRTPSFPVRLTPGDTGTAGMAAGAPTSVPQPIGAIGVFTSGGGRAVETAGSGAPAIAAGTVDQAPIVTLLRPESNDGIWIRYAGTKWVSDGTALPLDLAVFTVVGEYAESPVYAREGADVIYVPTRAGLVAPFRRR